MSDAEDESEDVLPPSPAPRASQTTPGSPTSVTGQQTPRGSPSASQRTLARFIFGQRRSTTAAVAAPETANQIAVVAVRDTEHPPLPVLHIPEADDLVVRPVAEDPDVEIVSEEEAVGEGSPEVISVDEDSDTASDTAEEEREVTQPASPVPGTVPETSESLPQAPSDLTEETTQGREPPAASTTPAVYSLVDQRESPADFRSPKRRRIFSPPKSTTAEEGTGANCADDEEDADCCPICFEDWTTSGSHRLASLRCGHLFGQSCIEKWLKGQGGKCPHCNTKAKRQDIRVLYAKSIKAVDTTERDRALQELQKEREAKKKVEMEAAQTRLQYTLVVEERNRLRTELDRLKQQLQAHRGSTSNATAAQMTATPMAREGQGNGQFFLDKTIKIWDILSLDFKSSQYLTIHSKQIRDVAFHPFVDDGILLSCGLDKMVKMTSIISNAVVQTYETQNPIWSCVWNADDRNLFYAGQTNGTVLEYDIRNTSEHVQELNKEGSRSPVVSLQYIPKDVQATFRQGGLLVGQLNGISFYEKKPDNQHRLHMLPLEGNLTSLCFEPNTRHLLVSFRPTAKHPNSRHQLCEMVSSNLSIDPAVIDYSCTCHVIQTFNGSQRQTVLTRSLLLPHPTDQTRMFVCAGEEPKSGMAIWDSSSGHLRQSMSVGGVVVDICAVHANHNTYIAALTEKQLKVFKWT